MKKSSKQEREALIRSPPCSSGTIDHHEAVLEAVLFIAFDMARSAAVTVVQNGWEAVGMLLARRFPPRAHQATGYHHEEADSTGPSQRVNAGGGAERVAELRRQDQRCKARRR